MANPVVTFEMENGDIMKAELYPEIAANTVRNFISLIKKGYYDGLIFHRVISGFMIQGGCPDGTGMGGPGYSIRGEFSQNGFENLLEHDAGVLSMARAMHPDSAGSQFFIMHKKSSHLGICGIWKSDGGNGRGRSDCGDRDGLSGPASGSAGNEKSDCGDLRWSISGAGDSGGIKMPATATYWPDARLITELAG